MRIDGLDVGHQLLHGRHHSPQRHGVKLELSRRTPAALASPSPVRRLLVLTTTVGGRRCRPTSVERLVHLGVQEAKEVVDAGLHEGGQPLVLFRSLRVGLAAVCRCFSRAPVLGQLGGSGGCGRFCCCCCQWCRFRRLEELVVKLDRSDRGERMTTRKLTGDERGVIVNHV